MFDRFHFVFIFIKLRNTSAFTTDYFFCSTREEIRFPVLPPNWNAGVGIILRRQNSENIN
jgi:hypothetical protein